MKTLLSIALFLTMGAGAFAGLGWYVTIKNQTANNVTISPAGHDWWYPIDFGVTQTMRPYESKVFFTEDALYYEGYGPIAGIIGINIDYGYGSQCVEMWTGDHFYSVTENIRHIEYGGYKEWIGTTSDAVYTDIFNPTELAATIYVLLTLHASPTVSAHEPAADDINGDGIADAAMVSNGTWHVYSTGSGFRTGVSLWSYSSHDLGLSGAPLYAVRAVRVRLKY